MAARPSWLSVIVIAGLASGCVTTREQEISPAPSVVQAYLDDKPTELRRHFFIAQAQGDRNRVLNDMRLGLASLGLGRDQLAAQLFDDALGGIEAIYADNDDARKARGLWVKEGTKDFKGEPYERVMAYYYRGLLYMKAGDYENARASFKGGLLQDSFAEEEQFRADFALMPFLQGWAAHCSGNESLAAEDFKEFRAINKDAPLPRDKDNVLVLVETGAGPVKISDGPRLKIKRSGGTETARISWADPEHPKDHSGANAILLEDIFRQASTRGGRPFDSILEGKADYKDTADTVGNIALVGAVLAAKVAVDNGPRRHETKEQRKNREQAQAGAAMVGAGLAVIGGLSKLFASSIEAQADTRYWDNLSDRVQGLTLSLPEKLTALQVEFRSSGGTTLETVEIPIRRAGKCGLVWAHHGSTLPRNPRAPNSVPPDVMASPIVIPAPEARTPVAEAKSKE